MKPCPHVLARRLPLLTVMTMMMIGTVDAQISERSSWALGVHGTAEAGVVRGRVHVPLALGTAPGTTHQDLSITGGMTYGAGMQLHITYRPPASPATAAVSIGMLRRHIAASSDVGEWLLTDLDGGQADLLYDQTVMMTAIDGRYRLGGGWHLVGTLGLEMPIGGEQAALWVFETGSSRAFERLQQRSRVRYRTTVNDSERLTVGLGLSRDVVVGMHGNTGVLLSPQLAVVAGSSFAAGSSWFPIVIRVGVTLTWTL